MATLQLPQITPSKEISTAIPQAIQKALQHIFSLSGKALWLVGGTAIAGYYAEHRRSDDLDFFALTAEAFRAGVLAVQSLHHLGVQFSRQSSSPMYYRADVQFQSHRFTIDVVLDEHLATVGRALPVNDAIWIADFETLLSMKTACLVSRCSEKDLFDLDWMLKQIKQWSIEDLIQLGSRIDGGVNSESLLVSLHGAMLRKEACSFLVPTSQQTEEEAYRSIVALKKKLIQFLLEHERTQSLSPEAKALVEIKKRIRKLSTS